VSASPRRPVSTKMLEGGAFLNAKCLNRSVYLDEAVRSSQAASSASDSADPHTAVDPGLPEGCC
jgi:hypothetical protein